MAAGPEHFPTTRWTLVRSAQVGSETRRRALRELLGDYWRPLYVFLRSRGAEAEAAQDTLQGFFAQLLERDGFVADLDPDRGQLRSYLRTALKRYAINEHERQQAQKRGGGQVHVALDLAEGEASLGGCPNEPERAYDREWAVGVFEGALQALEAEFEGGKRSGSFALVRRYFRGDLDASYSELARDQGVTATQLKAQLHRARMRFRQLVRQRVADTVRDVSAVDEEVAWLVEVLR